MYTVRRKSQTLDTFTCLKFKFTRHLSTYRHSQALTMRGTVLHTHDLPDSSPSSL